MKSKAAEGARAREGALSTWTIPSSLMAQGHHKDRRYIERHFRIGARGGSTGQMSLTGPSTLRRRFGQARDVTVKKYLFV